ncbi:hypothetical protein Tco_1012732 [Tanacetum coccineum]
MVATSTTKAEYVVAASCYRKVLWIQNQLLDYGYNFMNTVINIDNNSTICIIENPVQHSKTKDIEIRHHFIRDGNTKKLIQMVKIHTDYSVADLLTKGFDAGRFQYLVSKSDGFAEIIDFLKASYVHYALTVNPIIYTSCIEQFWAIAKVQTVNGVRELQALVDKKRVIVTESSIRRDLHLDDAKGTDCLPTATIFEELGRMSAWNEFSCSMASLIICLATNQKFNMSKYIFDAMVKHLDGGVKFLMNLRFLQVFINQQLGDMSTHKKIFVNPFHTMKVFANMKRAGKDFSGRITPLFDTMMVQPSEEVGEDSGHLTDSTQVPILDQPSTSSKTKKKQSSKKTHRHEAEVSQDETEHEESVPMPSNDPQPSGEGSMQLTDLMVLCTKLQTQVLDLKKAKDTQAKEIAALKKRIQRLERKKMSRPTGLKRLKIVGMSRRVESSEDQESLVTPEDASKQGRSIADIDVDVEVTLVDETQERQDDELIDSSGVHFVRFDNVHIFMLVEKRYPLTTITITNILNKKLQTNHQNEMCYQLLKLMVKQQKGQCKV